MLTAVHKHYSIEEWKEFAAENPDILPVPLISLYLKIIKPMSFSYMAKNATDLLQVFNVLQLYSLQLVC